jgi:hypothetical protein
MTRTSGRYDAGWALSRERGRARDVSKGMARYAAAVALDQCWAASALKRRSVRRETR